MRKQFPGHYTPSNVEFKKIWTEGLIILDTNVLLDFYRYSDETIDTLFKILDSVKERVWIPYTVSKEYHKNLNNVISGQIKKYTDSIKTLQDFRKQINEKRNHPFLSKELHEEINSFCQKFDSELEDKREKVKSLITANPTKEKLADILEEKLGVSFTNEQLNKIYDEGQERYKKMIPPGYKDSSKPDPEKFNDLVIWKEILEKNSKSKTPILLITGDKKEDWFLQEMGITIGPRPELIEEFKTVNNNLFYCYSTDTFLKYSEEYLGIKVEENIVAEVGEHLSKERSENQTEAEVQRTLNDEEQTSTVEKTSTESETFSSTSQDSVDSNETSC